MTLTHIKLYHLHPGLFGYFFAFNASALILANLSLIQLKKYYFSIEKIIILAISMSLLGGVIMLLAVNAHIGLIWSIVFPAFLATYGVGILYAELTATALQNIVAYTGIASALIGTIRFALASCTSILIGILIITSALPLAIIMLILICCTALSMCLYFRYFAT